MVGMKQGHGWHVKLGGLSTPKAQVSHETDVSYPKLQLVLHAPPCGITAPSLHPVPKAFETVGTVQLLGAQENVDGLKMPSEQVSTGLEGEKPGKQSARHEESESIKVSCMQPELFALLIFTGNMQGIPMQVKVGGVKMP
jgi:hypothetical protein